VSTLCELTFLVGLVRLRCAFYAALLETPKTIGSLFADLSNTSALLDDSGLEDLSLASFCSPDERDGQTALLAEPAKPQFTPQIASVERYSSCAFASLGVCSVTSLDFATETDDSLEERLTEMAPNSHMDALMSQPCIFSCQKRDHSRNEFVFFCGLSDSYA
jgi:hypothetical protein